jgi:hypothetical protein
MAEQPADFADGTDADRFKEDVLIRADRRYPRSIQSKNLVWRPADRRFLA